MNNVVMTFLIMVLIITGNLFTLLIYLKLIKKKFRFKYLVIKIVISLLAQTFFSNFFFIFDILFFFLLAKCIHCQINRLVIWLFCVYTVFSYSVIGNLFLNLIMSIQHNQSINTNLIMEVIVQPITFLFSLLILKFVHSSIDFLSQHSEEISQNMLITADITLTLICTVQFTTYWVGNRYQLMSQSIRYILTLSFIIILLFFLVYIDGKCREIEQRRLQIQKDLQLKDLSNYIKQVETLYEEIRGFRHDYKNVLISMNESIQTRDIATIESTYKNVLANEGIAFDDSYHSLTKLNHLRTLPIKGIISTHIIQAWQKELDVSIEIEDEIENEDIDTLDYVRIVSILLTNAIEAAESSKKKCVTIVFFLKDKTTVHIVFENSYSIPVDSDKIFNRGYSTKGKNRGIGLTNVIMILNNYDNIFLQTEVTDEVFTQHLIINKSK